MARYYDMDKLKDMLEAKADTLIEGKEAFLYIAKWLDLLPPAEVASKSEDLIFKNSPFEMLDIAFKKLFPDVKYTAYFEPNIRDEPNGDKVLGLTDFADNGEITIFIDTDLSINNSVEIFAHELAHAGVGMEHDHDEVWEKAFDDLFKEYNRIGEEMFSSNINAPKGKDYSTALNEHEKEYIEREKAENAEHCVICGDIIPEGRQICPNCERR